jgi:hypothetical protein
MNASFNKARSPPEYEERPQVTSSQDLNKLVKNGNNLQADQFIIGKYILMLDEKIVKEVDIICYKKDYLIKSLVSNDINYATTAYYLLSQYNSQI